MKKHPSEPVTVFCAGGCGKIQKVRKSRIRPHDFYCCGQPGCRNNLPPRSLGQIESWELNAAGSFWGVSQRFPTSEEAESVARAQQILKAGLAQLGLPDESERTLWN